VNGFTLLELMIVIIIVGVLATLGVTQYSAAIEKSRGAEAKMVISQLRSMCGATQMSDISTAACAVPAGVPTSCTNTNYFSYGISGTATTTTAIFTATRCIASGKSPNGAAANTLILTTVYTTGSDTWSGTGGY
jgi:prepilin-type N-terminal cleavage/methylation domain-containing protein